MALGNSTRDQVFLQTFGTLPPTVAPEAGYSSHLGRINSPSPNADAALAAQGMPNPYLGNIEIYKAYVMVPTNQGQRAAVASRQSMMFEPRNNPSRSQFSEGYTLPIQSFQSNNTWQTPSGQNTAGKRQSQPSTKLASPFSAPPIPTRMPWDL